MFGIQEARLNTLDRFRKGEFRLLVATDVIGRGIDIPQVSHVIVFDMGSIDDYVHRIGRTARGKDGHGKVTWLWSWILSTNLSRIHAEDWED